MLKWVDSRVKISCSRAPVTLELKKIKKINTYKCQIKKNHRCSQWCIPQTSKKSTSNTLYSELHKNEQNVDLSISIFKFLNFIRFYHFCVAHNIFYLKLIFCTFVGYTLGYIRIFFPDFVKTGKYNF